MLLQGALALVSFVFYIFHAPMALAPNHGLAADAIIPQALDFGEYDPGAMQGFYQEVGAESKDIDSWIAVPRQNAIRKTIWRWDTNGIHDVTLQEQELHLVNKVSKVTAHRFYQEVSLYFEINETESYCNSEYNP